MTEAEWDAGADPWPLDHMGHQASQRRVWLLFCGVLRMLGKRAPRHLSRLIDSIERYADGGMDEARLKQVCAPIMDIRPTDPWSTYNDLKRIQARKKRNRRLLVAAHRDILAMPMRPVALPPAWLAWNDGAIRKLAQSIYDARAFDRLPLLADALEDAGCTDADILSHCRTPGEHVRGCWVVDLLLGKS